MSRCTWVMCSNEAAQPQISQDQGDVWCELCDGHAVKLREAMDEYVADEKRLPQLTNTYVTALGGITKYRGRRHKREQHQANQFKADGVGRRW